MNMRNRMSTVLFAMPVLLFVTADARAQEDPDDLEATIRLMGAAEAELPDAVTREIELPDNVDIDAAAVEAAAQGLERANEGRAQGEVRREQGQENAADARENAAADARENASDMAEAARENAENRSRADEFRPDPPPGPPEDPGPQSGITPPDGQ